MAAPGGVGVGTGKLVDSFDAFADLSERYSTNATGSSVAPASDFDTRADFGLSASKSTVRINANVNYMLGLDYFANESSDVTISNNLSASTVIDVIPDHILFQATAFASPVYISRLGNVAPLGEALPPGANSDIENSYGFTLEPDFSFRLGDFLRSDLLPSYSAYYYDRQNGAGAVPLGLGIAPNVTTRSVTERLSTGQYFERVQASVMGSYSEMGESTGGLIERSAMGELSYAIDHGISIVGDVGYQTVAANVPFKSHPERPDLSGGDEFRSLQVERTIPRRRTIPFLQRRRFPHIPDNPQTKPERKCAGRDKRRRAPTCRIPKG